MLGCESEVSIPMRCSFRVHGEDSGVGDSEGSGSSQLVLRLRQVNGDGVMSGVRKCSVVLHYIHANPCPARRRWTLEGF